MSSIFNKDPGRKTPLPAYAKERIEGEIGHLKKRTSVRDAKQKKRTFAAWLLTLVVLGLLWLFFMDPVLRGLKRSEAIRDYLYLHNFGSDAKAQALAGSGYFAPTEIEVLNRRQGSFQDYYASPGAADREADALIAYVKGVDALHRSDYPRLDLVNKVRYQLFVRFGLMPPTDWAPFDPAING